jgi:branched-chain amino acid transport system substrate-binding protein
VARTTTAWRCRTASSTYLNLINSRGGVNGRQVVLKTLDDDNKAANLAEANARQLVEKDQVFVLFGSD